MMNIKNTVTETQNPLGFKKESRLLVEFAIPCVISMLVTALYNIVDQIFIGQGVGMLGKCRDQHRFPHSPRPVPPFHFCLHRKCHKRFPETWSRKRKGICKLCRLWHPSYDNIGNCFICHHDSLSHTNAYVFRSNQRGSSLCKTIYTNYCDRISFPDHEHRYGVN